MGPLVGVPVYPYKRRIMWWLHGRHGHLLKALEREGIPGGQRGNAVKRRMRRLQRFMLLRILMLGGLSFSVVASVILFLLSPAPGTGGAEDAIRGLARIAYTLTPIFTLVYFFTLRTLGQLEMDVLMLLRIESPDLPHGLRK